MVAQRGFQETAPNGDRFLVLLNSDTEPEPGWLAVSTAP